MKNLKINQKIFNKRKYALVIMPVIATIVLSGCSLTPDGDRARYSNTNNNSYQTNYSTVDNAQNNNVEIDLDNLNIPLKNIGSTDLSKTVVKYNNNQHIIFNSYLNSVNVVYDYKDIYNFKECLKEYKKLKFSKTHESKLINLNSNDLYNVILQNNKLYKKTNKSSIYKELSSSELKNICNLIISTSTDFIESNEKISIDRVKCVLSNLKLFKQNSSMNNAFVTNDNCLILSPNMMKFANTINGKGTDQDVLIHEIIHLLQKGCNCDLSLNDNLKRNFGICYGFDNVKINSLDFTWFYEAAAEKNMVNYTNHEPLVYKNMIGYLESLSIVNLVNDTYKVNDTEKLTFKRTHEDLYKYFGATTQEEKEEVLNLMYSIEVMQQAPDAFYELLEQKTGKKKDSTLIDEVNYTVKVDICETLTKLFYKNLSKNIVNKDVSLGDIFYLISVFENDINNHILYNSTKKYNYNEHFMNTYISIQDNFFLQLSKSINCSQEEIENSYNNYNSNVQINGVVTKNYNLNFLSEEKKDYLNEREKALNTEATYTIRNVANEFLKQNIEKVSK